MGFILHAVGRLPVPPILRYQGSCCRYLALYGPTGARRAWRSIALPWSSLASSRSNLTGAARATLALVAVILGRRNPLGVLIAALVLGSAEALQIRLQTLGSTIPSQAFNMLPYVVTVLVLMLSMGKGHDPAALGLPYERDKR